MISISVLCDKKMVEKAISIIWLLKDDKYNREFREPGILYSSSCGGLASALVAYATDPSLLNVFV
jgi:hypothetical protein